MKNDIYKLIGGESKVQGLRFPIGKYTSDSARKWMKKYNFKPIKRVEKTENYLNYRMFEAKPKKGYIFRTKKFGDILAIIEIKSTR